MTRSRMPAETAYGPRRTASRCSMISRIQGSRGSLMRGVIPAALVLVALQPGSASAALAFLRAIELPGVHGRIDHLAVDATADKLFVAALGNNSVEVL